MTDDPKKVPKRAAPKMSDEEFERFYREIYAEFGEKKPKEDEELAKLLGTKNTKSGTQVKTAGNTSQSAAQKKTQNAGSRNAYTDNTATNAPTKKKQKGVKGLVIAICLECLGIVGVVLWWLLRIL